ncbi:hypothetical protein BDP27DRAFT_1325577 [Rhodocollybia butyracea]|uniref:DUF6534 domain-containing protein n=1 Tax=Rhodocollybia butyracea TaxID=206335 RepID=A0A9P5PU74_9AGAR|nr:hypothetical protein BDP27DRAFT_1325577 [Rhodocollybia butyracea]
MESAEVYAIDPEETYGGMMVGLLLASLMCGTAGVQALIFFLTGKIEPISHKISVTYLWILGVLQICFIFSATYFYVVKEAPHGVVSPRFIWNLKIQIFMQVLIMCSTKFMYALRLWKLRDFISKWAPIGLSVFLLFDLAIGAVFAYEVFTVELLHDLVNFHFKPIAVVSMCITTVSDFLVGALLIYAFAKSNVTLSWTTSSTTMLVAYVVNTGIMTGFFSAAVLISFATGIYQPTFAVFEMALPQFYINCFFSMMNAGTYFQTNQNSSRSSVTHILPYAYDELGFADPILASSTIDSLSQNASSGLILKLDEISPSEDDNHPTINEIGLPLFKAEPKPEPIVRPGIGPGHVPVEVVVRTTHHETTTDLRRGRRTVVHR